jgi:RHS repeat-associated protein
VKFSNPTSVEYDYSLGEMYLPNRHESSNSYRYGFQGQEKDDEVSGEGNSYGFGARLYNPRVGRFLSLDPLAVDYPWQSPYVYAGNNPIYFLDREGMATDPFREKFYREMGKAVIKAVTTMTVQETGEKFSANKYKSLYMVAQRRMENGFNSNPPGNNPFNIKGTGDNGSVNYGTHEYENGKKINKKASFANFSTLEAGIQGYIDLLSRNFKDAYSALMDDSKTVDDFSKGLMNGRLGAYATDPQYQEKFHIMLKGVVKDYAEMLNTELEQVNSEISKLKTEIKDFEEKCTTSTYGIKYMRLVKKLYKSEQKKESVESDIEELNEFKKNEGFDEE